MIFAYLIASGENILINIIMYIAHSLYSLIICNYPDMFRQSTIYQSVRHTFINGKIGVNNIQKTFFSF